MVSILASTTIELKKKSQDPQVHGENMSKGSVGSKKSSSQTSHIRALTKVSNSVGS